MQTLVSLLVGSAVTWFVAWFYFKRAGDQLASEAKSLHAATGAIIYFLENPGAKATVRRDANGRVEGLVVQVSGKATVTFSASGTLRDANGA